MDREQLPSKRLYHLMLAADASRIGRPSTLDLNQKSFLTGSGEDLQAERFTVEANYPRGGEATG